MSGDTDYAPPRVTRSMLQRSLPGGVRGESIQGDLEEEFARKVEAGGSERAAREWYRRQARRIIIRYSMVRWLARWSAPLRRLSALLVTIATDMRWATRAAVASKGVSGAIVLMLALGIGANTAAFSVVNTVLLRSLPFLNPERVVQVWDEFAGSSGEPMPVSWPNFLDYRENTDTLENLAALVPAVIYTGGGTPLRGVASLYASGSLFSMLRTGPVAGRLLEPTDDGVLEDPPALVSYTYWQNELGGAADIVGATLSLQRMTFGPSQNRFVSV